MARKYEGPVDDSGEVAGVDVFEVSGVDDSDGNAGRIMTGDDVFELYGVDDTDSDGNAGRIMTGDVEVAVIEG